MRTGAPAGGGKGTRTSAAQRPSSPALCCLRGGESELHAPSAPPPPDFSPKPAFSGSLSPQEVLDPSPNCPRCAEIQIPSHRPKTTNNSRVHSSAGETGYPNSKTSSQISPNSAPLSNDSGLYFPNSQSSPKTPSVNSPRHSLLTTASQNPILGSSGSRVPLNASYPSLKRLPFPRTPWNSKLSPFFETQIVLLSPPKFFLRFPGFSNS